MSHSLIHFELLMAQHVIVEDENEADSKFEKFEKLTIIFLCQ
jgi:hypothetical protein